MRNYKSTSNVAASDKAHAGNIKAMKDQYEKQIEELSAKVESQETELTQVKAELVTVKEELKLEKLKSPHLQKEIEKLVAEL